MPLRISPRAIAAMRRAAIATMVDTCVLCDLVRTSDGAGGWIEEQTPISELPCRIESDRSSNTVIGSTPLEMSRSRLTVPWYGVLTTGKQVIFAGLPFEIREVFTDATPLVFREAYIERIG